MDDLYRRLNVLFRRVLQDAVSDVEDVAGATSSAAQDIVDAFFHFRDGSEQRNRIQIPLHGSIVTDGLPAVIERDSPIQADHVSTRPAHEREQGGRTRAKVDDRHTGGVSRVQHFFGIGKHEFFEIRRAERAHP